MPGAFNAIAATTVGCSYFTANWAISAGATGYYLDVATNSSFSSFVTGFENLPVSNVLTYTVTGLVGSTTYYYRVRAVNSCGTTTNSNTITQATYACALPLSTGCDPAQIEADYGTLVSTSLSGSPKIWLPRNLGATAQASSATDISNAAAGCYYQFNRSQAYGWDNGGAVNPAWTIFSIDESSDWLISNDPCRLMLGGDWRLPTGTEFNNADLTDGWGTYLDTYASVFKLHAAGWIDPSGSFGGRGVNGNIWCSTQTTTIIGTELTLQVGECFVDDYINPKAFGFPVRCLK